MSAKQAIDDKLQSSVATYLRCNGSVNNQIMKGSLLSLQVKNFLKSVNIWQIYKQERGCLMHFARLANTLLKDEESARDNLFSSPGCTFRNAIGESVFSFHFRVWPGVLTCVC